MEDGQEVENGADDSSFCDARVHVRRRKVRCPTELDAEATSESWLCESGLLWEWGGPEEVLLDEREVLRMLSNCDTKRAEAVLTNNPWHSRQHYAHITSFGISPNARWLTYQASGQITTAVFVH